MTATVELQALRVGERTIAAADLDRRMADLVGIGLGARGTNRLAWTEEDRAARHWFCDQAEAVGLTPTRDPAGNLWAYPSTCGPWWAVGSHLDSVRDGGRYDGALGVAAAFEVAARAPVPIAVISFADEEGARFNTPTFGSKALSGLLDETVLARADERGVTLADAMAGAGVDPRSIGRAPAWRKRLRGFLELHIDQTQELAELGLPAAPVRGLAARSRLHVGIDGRADHAGSTPPERRRDALSACAALIVEAERIAAAQGVRATPTRILNEPNALTTIAARVDLWIDGRCEDAAALEPWRAAVREAAERIAAERDVAIAVETNSHSDGGPFAPELRAALRRACGQDGAEAPEVTCWAGHDAGILAPLLPSAMVLVRNATGVSHAPEEHVTMEDAAAGASALLAALRELSA